MSDYYSIHFLNPINIYSGDPTIPGTMSKTQGLNMQPLSYLQWSRAENQVNAIGEQLNAWSSTQWDE